MKPLKAFAKQLFGARYERITKSLAVCLIIFFALFAAEIRVTIAPSILFLTATFFSFGMMWQEISAEGNAEWMMGLFALPFKSREFTASYLLAFGGCALISRVLPVLTIFWTVGKWSISQIGLSALCACAGCILAPVWYVISARKKRIPSVLLGCGLILTAFFANRLMLSGRIVAVILAAVLYLLNTDAYTFYCPATAKKLSRRTRGKGSVLLYLLRYLFTNKSYLLNTAGLWAIACLLPLMLGQFEEQSPMFLGFAILCLNTPICTLLSSDPALEQAIRVLPGQAVRFCIRYCFFIFAVNMTANSLYLLSWQFQNSGVEATHLLTATLFSLQSAIFSTMLEWFSPLRNWKTQNDLWHHPRKLVVPLLLMLAATLVSSHPHLLWIWLLIMLIQCLILTLLSRKT